MQQPEQDIAARAADTIQFWAKMAGAAVIIWQLVERVAKPYFAWRNKRFETSIRAILKKELECINGVVEGEGRIEALLERVIERQDEIFADLDLFIEVAQDNRDRHDETTELLNALGYASKDRRATERRDAKTPRIDSLMSELSQRARERRRRIDDVQIRRAGAARDDDTETRT